MMRRLTGVLLLMAAVALLLGACGDDDDGNSQQVDSVPTHSAITGQASESSSGPSAGAPTITISGPIGALPGVNEECVALANGFLGIAQLLAQAGIDANQVNAEFTKAASGDLPDEIQDDLTTVLAAVAYPGGITEVDPEQLVVVNDALDRLQAYAERECPSP